MVLSYARSAIYKIAAIVFFIIASLSVAGADLNASAKKEENQVDICAKKITPILLVQDIEPSQSFWTQHFGFETTVEARFEDKLGFVILRQGSVELMYQSIASAKDDITGAVENIGTSIVYLEVRSLNPILEKIDAFDVVIPERQTDYGAKEIFIREPGGHVVGISQQAAQSE